MEQSTRPAVSARVRQPVRIDAHQHFWKYNDRDYGWRGAGMGVLKRNYLPEDLRPLLREVGSDGSIAVQARQSLEETRWLLELADGSPSIFAVVGWVDLRDPDVVSQLESFSSHAKFHGVRHVVHDEPDDRFLLRGDFLRGVSHLSDFGLTYDLLLFPRHLAVACDFVAGFPRHRFVLDHIAKPPIRSREIADWARDIGRLGRFPNVYCKLSGLVTEADWTSWRPEDFTPYLDVVLDTFGTGRLMVGSDWPVCTVAASYADTMKLVKDYLARLTREDQEAILGANAVRCYDISLPQPCAGGESGGGL